MLAVSLTSQPHTSTTATINSTLDGSSTTPTLPEDPSLPTTMTTTTSNTTLSTSTRASESEPMNQSEPLPNSTLPASNLNVALPDPPVTTTPAVSPGLQVDDYPDQAMSSHVEKLPQAAGHTMSTGHPNGPMQKKKVSILKNLFIQTIITLTLVVC